VARIDQPTGARSVGPTLGLTILLASMSALGAITVDMSLPIMPTLAQVFAVEPARVQATLSALLLGLGMGQLVHGPLADRLGRRPVILGALSIYIVASLAALASTSIEMLTLARFAQGLTGGAGHGIARAIIRDLFERDQAAAMMSRLFVLSSLGPLSAPLIGGQILLWFGWRGIHACFALLALVCLVAVWFLLRETLREELRQTSPASRVAINYLRLFGDRIYLGNVLTMVLGFTGMFVYLAQSPFVFIQLFGVSPRAYGLIFALNVLGMMGWSALGARLVVRLGAARLVTGGAWALLASGAFVGIVAISGWGGMALLVLALFAYVPLVGLVSPNASAAAMQGFPHMAGQAAALAGAVNFVLGAAAGWAIGFAHDGTAAPMGIAIALAGAAAFLAHRLMIGVRPTAPRDGE
jgi:DHA1 family bicyclomycin/chloramphenicol resistance-like MFS transporter